MLWAYSRTSQDQRELHVTLYHGLHSFFRTYNISTDLSETISDPADRFYGGFVRTLSSRRSPEDLAVFGGILCAVAPYLQSFVFDLLNRVKTRGDDRSIFPLLSAALSDRGLFRTVPYQCILLLARVNPPGITEAISHQPLSNVDTRRIIAAAVLAFAYDSPDQHAARLFSDFASRTGSELQINFGFSLLVEPLLPEHQKMGSERKAALVAAVLGITADAETVEYFRARMGEIGDLLMRQSQTTDPNRLGQFGYNILDNIRLSRKWMVSRIRGALRDTVVRFFRTVEGFVTTEQAKLIRDTVLEISLASARAVYEPHATRVTVEIRNAGHGTADGLELEVLPVEGQYEVDPRHRLHHIESLSGRVPIQCEVWISPVVPANSTVGLSMQLRYNTLKERGKVAFLPQSDCGVSLYPEAQFVRVAQPYSIGEPATTWFYGRQGLLDSMAGNLHYPLGNDQSMIVYGLKRAGKTSVLKRFINHTMAGRADRDLYIPVYCDLLSDPAVAYLKKGGFLRLIAEILCRGTRPLLPSAHLASNLAALDDDFKKDPSEAFSVVLEEVLGSLAPRRLLLALDEFSTLDGWLAGGSTEAGMAEAAFGYLSNTLQSTTELTFVFTGTYMLLEMMRARAFDLAKVCVPYMVGFLDEHSARQLVEQPVRRAPGIETGWLEYDPRAVDSIVRLTNRHPYLIQYVCMQIVDRMNQLRHSAVMLNDVEVVRKEVALRPMHAPQMLTLWNEFSDAQHLVLSSVASLAVGSDGEVEVGEIVRAVNDAGREMSEREAQAACGALADAEMLERINGYEAVTYRITVPLLHEWLRENRPLGLQVI
jgi:hypothetical protein